MQIDASGDVKVTIAGEDYTLRYNLAALKAVEARLGFKGVLDFNEHMENRHLGTLYALIDEAAKAGGKAIPKERLDNLSFSELEGMGGALSASTEAPDEGIDDEAAGSPAAGAQETAEKN